MAFLFRPPYSELGAWQTYVRLSPARACAAAIPYNLAPQTAAAGITSTVIALACLRHFPSGTTIVVPGAAGAVGLAVVQLAANKGMRALGLVRDPPRVAQLTKEFGDTKGIHFIDCSAPSWLEDVLQHCELDANGVNGADGVVDGIGGSALIQIAEQVVRPHGLL